MILLRQRRRDKYSDSASLASLRPGHPVYERIRGEVMADYRASQPSEAEVLARLKAKITRMRERKEAAAKLMLQDSQAEDAEWEERA